MLKLSDDDFNRLVSFIKSNYGINLEKKRVLIEGRLTGIVNSEGYSSFEEYLSFALKDGKETMRLVNKLTTNHTFFMREPEHFKFLETDVLPYIEKSVKDRDARLWCAASSTGQEPYTLVMTIDEYFGSRKSSWDTTLLATDIDTEVLKKAKDGIYEEEMLDGLSSKWIDKYFKKLPDGRYQVIDRLRNEVVFKKFNLMDPIVYKKPYDLISCRNVMIYFETDTKNALIERFYDATKVGGYLFIGHAESVPRNARYSYVKPAIYRRDK